LRYLLATLSLVAYLVWVWVLIPIQFNAIGERFEENSGSTVVGRQSGQPVQSILESIPALQTLDIQVSVRLFGDVFSSNPPSHDEFAALTPESQNLTY
jgi:hypothetical protein